MNILLDTHLILWALNDDPKLPKRARSLILNPENTIYYSVVSVWEVSLKHAVRPDNVELDAREFTAYCQRAGFVPLDLTDKHVHASETLTRPEDAPRHSDPFDRLLLAQAKAERFFFLTHDSKFPGYQERCILAV